MRALALALLAAANQAPIGKKVRVGAGQSSLKRMIRSIFIGEAWKAIIMFQGQDVSNARSLQDTLGIKHCGTL